MAGNKLISLHSSDGHQLLKEVQEKGDFQANLYKIFTKQVGGTSCGLVSCCLVMSAKTATDKFMYTESNMFNYSQTQVVLKQDEFQRKGMTLVQVRDLLLSHGCQVKMVHSEDSSVEEFRSDAIRALSHADSSCAVVVNYHMKTLGQSFDFGHHSPIAGYHAGTDRLLLLDTWPSSDECWAEAKNLFGAMNTVDTDSGKTRGYCIATLP